MKRKNILLSTIADDTAQVVREFSLGVEIAEYCTAMNMDEYFPQTHAALEPVIAGIENRTFHGPFNELFPCAIDPKARKLAMDRFLQAASLAKTYGAEKLILHGGYNPYLYYPIWYREQSVPFWSELAERLPDGITVCVENVLEEEPEMLLDILQSVGSPKLQLCLDIGHVNAYSKISVFRWLEVWGDRISHFHIHNNHGDRDSHSALHDGTIPMEQFLRRAAETAPDATWALELLSGRESALFLQTIGIL